MKCCEFLCFAFCAAHAQVVRGMTKNARREIDFASVLMMESATERILQGLLMWRCVSKFSLARPACTTCDTFRYVDYKTHRISHAAVKTFYASLYFVHYTRGSTRQKSVDIFGVRQIRRTYILIWFANKK